MRAKTERCMCEAAADAEYANAADAADANAADANAADANAFTHDCGRGLDHEECREDDGKALI